MVSWDSSYYGFEVKVGAFIENVYPTRPKYINFIKTLPRKLICCSGNHINQNKISNWKCELLIVILKCFIADVVIGMA